MTARATVGNSDGSLLFVLPSANMQSTSDQAFTRVGGAGDYVIDKIIAVGLTGGATVACAGGIYGGAGKTGNIYVAATQSWLLVSAANKLVTATLAAFATTDITAQTPILSLTTGSTAACTAKLLIFGHNV